MKCKYCGTKIEFPGDLGQKQASSPSTPSSPSFSSQGVNCPECDSYYYLVNDNKKYWTFHAYPSKNYRQFYQNETIRVIKEDK
ncbi:MAG: hypothetical protein ACTSVZ_07280 [Promethearchaeota archaeon]